MKHNTIYLGENGQRMIHRHLSTGYAVSVQQRINRGRDVKAFKASGDGSFMWEISLAGRMTLTSKHEGLCLGEKAVDMPIIRKKKTPLYDSIPIGILAAK